MKSFTWLTTSHFSFTLFVHFRQHRMYKLMVMKCKKKDESISWGKGMTIGLMKPLNTFKI